MANDSTGAYGEPQYSASGAPADAADLSQIATYAAYHGTRIVDTTTARNAAIGTAGVRTGLRWRDTTDGNEYEYLNGAWTLVYGDTGWITPTLTNGFVVGQATPQYRLIGNQMFFRGDLGRSSAPTTQVTAFPLPGKYCPISHIAQPVGAAAWNCYIDVDPSTGNLSVTSTVPRGGGTFGYPLGSVTYLVN